MQWASQQKKFFFPLQDEILEKQKARQEELDEAKRKAAEKDGLGPKISDGAEGENAAPSIAELSSSLPDSEDANSATDKLAADGKSVLCVFFLFFFPLPVCCSF